MLKFMYARENDISDPICVCRMLAVKTRRYKFIIRCWWYDRVRYWWNDKPRTPVKWQFSLDHR